jgi:hypothetical protein
MMPRRCCSVLGLFGLLLLGPALGIAQSLRPQHAEAQAQAPGLQFDFLLGGDYSRESGHEATLPGGITAYRVGFWGAARLQGPWFLRVGFVHKSRGWSQRGVQCPGGNARFCSAAQLVHYDKYLSLHAMGAYHWGRRRKTLSHSLAGGLSLNYVTQSIEKLYFNPGGLNNPPAYNRTHPAFAMDPGLAFNYRARIALGNAQHGLVAGALFDLIPRHLIRFNGQRPKLNYSVGLSVGYNLALTNDQAAEGARQAGR